MENPQINNLGTKYWYNEQEINNLGTKYWYNEQGQLHREHGPAIEYANGNCEWYFDGQKHRTNGPAMIIEDIEYWFQYGSLHREDGPAFYDYEYDAYYQNNKLHRVNGPAQIWYKGLGKQIISKKNFVLNGNYFELESEYWKAIQKMKHNCLICNNL